MCAWRCVLLDVFFDVCSFAGKRISGCGSARFHAVAPSVYREWFDPTLFARLSDDIGALDELIDSLAVAGGGAQLKLVCERYY